MTKKEKEEDEEQDHFDIKDTLWKVIKFMKDKNTPVRLGQILRFGRVCFKVTDIKIPQPDQPEQKAPSYSRAQTRS